MHKGGKVINVKVVKRFPTELEWCSRVVCWKKSV